MIDSQVIKLQAWLIDSVLPNLAHIEISHHIILNEDTGMYVYLCEVFIHSLSVYKAVYKI